MSVSAWNYVLEGNDTHSMDLVGIRITTVYNIMKR